MAPPLAVLTFLALAPPSAAQENAPSPDCADVPEWVDSLGNACAFYSDRCGDAGNAANEFAGYTGDTACCACDGGYVADPDAAAAAEDEDADGRASVQDLRRAVSVSYPDKAEHDSLADIAPPAPLPKWQLRRNRASISYLHWGITAQAYDNYTAFYNDYAAESDEFGATTHQGAMDHVELTFARVVEELANTPGKEVSGEVIRMGDLGGFIFNHLLWDVYEDDWLQFPIGTSDVNLHRVARPLADYVMGRGSPVWSAEIIRPFAEEFFEGRNTLNNTHLRLWTNKLFHKLMLDMDMTDEDAEEFESYKSDYIVAAVLPTWLSSSMRWALGLESIRERRGLWLERYMEAIRNDQRGIYAQFELGEGRNLRFAADFFLTAFTAAGGISLPSVINHVLALVHGAAPINLEGADRVLTESNVEQFILETIRRFPLVLGFPMWAPDLRSRVSLSVGMAIRDPRVWDDSLAFRLRPLSEYHEAVGLGTKIGVAWAQQAKGHDGLTPDSRGCPAQDLSVVAIKEFLKVYMRSQDEWSVLSAPEGGISIGDDSQATGFTIARGDAATAGDEAAGTGEGAGSQTPGGAGNASDFANVDPAVISGAAPLRHAAQATIAMAAMIAF